MADKQRSTRPKARGSQVAAFSDGLWDITEIPRQTVLADYYQDGVRVLIKRGPFSMTVYLGVPSDHPLAGLHYDLLPVRCHGGLTFSGEGGNFGYPANWYWYGYDHSHDGDHTFYPSSVGMFDEGGTVRTLGEIKKEAWEAVWDFKKLKELAEQVSSYVKNLDTVSDLPTTDRKASKDVVYAPKSEERRIA